MKRAPVKKRPKQECDEAALIRRFGGTLPTTVAPAKGPVAAWLASLKTKAAGRTLNIRIRECPAFSKILSGIAATAPYLWDLIQADPARLVRLLAGDPDRALAALLAATYSAAKAARSANDLMRMLRNMKAEA